MDLRLLVTLYIAIFCLVAFQTEPVKAKAVVVLLDYTKASGKEWNAQIDFLMKVLGQMKGAKTGLIAMRCPAEALRKISTHDESDFRKKIASRTATKSQATADAFNLASLLLSGVKYGEGSLIVMSDGASSDCGTAPNQITEFQISASLRSLGFQTIYIPIGPIVSKENMARIAGEQTQIAEIKDFVKADSRVIQEVVQKVEHPANDSPPPPAVAAPSPGATQGPDQKSNTKAPTKPGITKGSDSQTYFGPDVSVITFTVPGSQQKLTTGRGPLQPSHKTPAGPDSQTDLPPGVSVYTITLPPGSREKGTPRPGPSQPSGKVTQGFTIPPNGIVMTAPPGYDGPSPPRTGPSNEQVTPGAGSPNKQVTPGPGPLNTNGPVTKGPPPTPGTEPSTLQGSLTRRNGESKAVVLILDGSSSVTGSKWRKLKDYVGMVADSIQDAKLGVVSIGCPSKKSIPLREYTPRDFSRELGKLAYLGGKIDLYGALSIARDMLEIDRSKWKAVLIFSSGQRGIRSCIIGNLREDESTVIEKLREDGVATPFFTFEGNGYSSYIRSLAGSDDYVVDIVIAGSHSEITRSLNEVERKLDNLNFPNMVPGGPAPPPPPRGINPAPNPPPPTRKPVAPPPRPRAPGPAGCGQMSLLERDGESKTVLFILDSSISVTAPKWKKLKEYVGAVATSIKDAKMGVISIGCPAKETIPIRDYGRWEFTRKLNALEYLQRKTDMYGAVRIARDMLELDRSKWKALLIFSDGHTATRTCTMGSLREDEYEITEKLREDGVATVFFTFEGKYGLSYGSYPRKLVGSADDVMDIDLTGSRMRVSKSLDKVDEKLGNLCFPNMGSAAPPPPPAPRPPPPPPIQVKPVRPPPPPPPPPPPRVTAPAGCGQVSLLERDNERKSVLFILDSSTSVTERKWKKLLEFVGSVAELIRDAKMGVISLACPSKRSIPLSDYTRFDFSRKLEKLPYLQGKTGMYSALDLARDMLDMDRNKWKALLIFSDARKPWRACRSIKIREDEIAITDQLRRDGVVTLLFTFEGKNGLGSARYMRDLVGSEDNVMDIDLTGSRMRVTKSLDQVEEKLRNLCFTGASPAPAPAPAPRRSFPDCPTGTSTRTKAVVFIVEATPFSKSNRKPKWTKKIDFVVEAADMVRGARVGVVALVCPSTIHAEMDSYTNSMLRRTLAGEPHTDKTDLDGAFSLAARMLRRETAEEKYVVVIASGRPHDSWCDAQITNNVRIKNDAVDIAEDWRNSGVRVLYVLLEPYDTMRRSQQKSVDKIVGSLENIIDAYPNNLTPTQLRKLMKRFCV